jgi:hypothetical protein
MGSLFAATEGTILAFVVFRFFGLNLGTSGSTQDEFSNR